MDHLSKEQLEELILSDATNSEKEEALKELLERTFEEGKRMILESL
jgi:hypothetical protein